MIERRPFNQLAAADHGWLKAKHHFSFGEFADPTRMGWGALRVWNDDEIAPDTGFPAHPHANMEIITYVREGAITHKDSLGNEGRTEAGDVQVMSAGSGIRHAEYNLEQKPTRIFQIWIIPTKRGGSPAWGSQPFPKGDRSGRFVTLASGFDEDTDALPIRADARVLGATLRAGESVDYALGTERHGYLVPASGAVEVNGTRIEARDGAAISDAAVIKVTAIDDSELVLVDTARYGGPAIAFDLFRFKDGKIAEHWGGQEPEEPPNLSGRTQVDGPTEVLDLDKTEANRALVRTYRETVMVALRFDRIEEFIEGAHYAQHASKIGDGIARLRDRIASVAKEGGKLYLTPRRFVADGNFVVVLSEGDLPTGPTALYDLFRVENGKIVEHWDVLTPIPPQDRWKNSNGPF
jgi:quercetin 2,3-dioxygenase